jgi:lipid A 4'-phosphatase
MDAPQEPSLRPRRERRAILFYITAFAFAAALFSLFPGIDLWASGLFYRVDGGFFLGQAWPMRAVYAGIPYVTAAVAIGVPALYLAGLWQRRPVWRIDGRAAVYLLLALALGPGLLVNAALKDHWGRARPSQVTEFGGHQDFTPALVPADQCQRNCSFPAGHPSIAFYFVSFAFLAAPRRRPAAIGAALAGGALVGAARLAQGGHFLSDVVFSGLLVCATSWLLHRFLIARDTLGALARLTGLTRPPGWLGLAAAGVIGAALLSMAVFDRPVARFFHDGNPAVAAVFRFITQFGLGRGYLIISAMVFAGLRATVGVTRDRPLARGLALQANRALFVFTAVALSGLAADLLKVVFGRARPKLLFAANAYGFDWGATRSDYWSLPSGHSTTAAALAVAFALLWPRGRPIYLLAAFLVMASRVVIGAHYPSDVLLGAALGAAFAGAAWRAFPRLGLPLDETAPAPLDGAGLSDSPENRGADRPDSAAPSGGRAE